MEGALELSEVLANATTKNHMPKVEDCTAVTAGGCGRKLKRKEILCSSQDLICEAPFPEGAPSQTSGS